ncbi:hypothetical protein [uncultured Chitinophaga sp.]|jgi:hypothetical protein|uniref:hypothetical protein n=1 Tax=uncultured Chitinophaga sp. TaxID=339340 RepID=UPI002622D2D7|nr:hypothetical protein [uncultured Chitinophaga sp.]
MIRLGSVVEREISANTEALTFIYSHLLKSTGVTSNKYIHVNHIGNDLEEAILYYGKEVFINIKYPLPENFHSKSDIEKQEVFLDILQAALCRLANEDKRITTEKLEAVKKQILQQQFAFEIVHRTYVNKKRQDLVAKVIVVPQPYNFDFYILIEDGDVQKCKLAIYRGKPTDYYIDDLFSTGKWKGEDEFILKGKKSEIEFHLQLSTCNLKFVNVTDNKDKAPLFELMKSSADKNKTLKDYIESLNPAIAAMLTNTLNKWQ